MRLELANFPVRNLVLSSRTRWSDGVLELDRDELLEPLRAEPNVLAAELDTCAPGESARVINYFDILEPRAKVDGNARTYPGRSGRSMAPVGEGRTHRLGGMSLIACLDEPGRWSERPWNHQESEYVPRPGRGGVWAYHRFVDMSGPGAVLPWSSTFNLCLTLQLKDDLDQGNRAHITTTALLDLQDKLAETTLGLDPLEVEVYDLTERDPALPGVVFTCLLASGEAGVGPRSASGTGIYGLTRLSAPWVLGPTEMFDGAVTGGGGHVTWPFTNNPIVLGLCHRHGKTLNFLGCIVGRTNWGAEEEMVLSGSRAAQAARLMGARGAIITNDVRGRRFVDSVRTIQAFEHLGINTVFVTEEEDNEGGNAPPFLYHPPEMAAVVSTGTGTAGPFPPVERVLGVIGKAEDAWYREQAAIPGRYGAGHVRDHYGVGRQSCIDY